MNTNRTGMRTVLAAAAAGALIMGSAAGAMAGPSKGKPAAKSTSGYVQLTKVDFHRHSPANVFASIAGSTKSAVTRDLAIRATVRDTAKAQGADPTSVTVTVARYTKKRGDLVKDGFTMKITLGVNKTKKNEKTYKGTVPGAEIRTAFAALPVGQSAFICIQEAELVAPKNLAKSDKKSVTKKEQGGDCIRIVNIDPMTTDSKSDDPGVPAPTS